MDPTQPAPVDATHGPAGETDPPLEVLEEDETVPPRPEEDVADVARAVPDLR